MDASKRSIAGLVVAVAVLLTVGGVAIANGPLKSVDPAPVGVWNDSDTPAIVALVGSQGYTYYEVPAHALGVLDVPSDVGTVTRLTVVRQDCHETAVGATFSDGASPFTSGGQMLIRDGAFGGWSGRLPAQWATPLDPTPDACSPS